MKGYLKKALAMMMAGAMVCGILTGCGSKTTETKAETTAETTAETGAESASGEVSAEVETIEDGVLKVAMECSYAPYNWTQPTDENGAVCPVLPENFASDPCTARGLAAQKSVARRKGFGYVLRK